MAELLSGFAQATANVTRVPGVTVDGTTEATVVPGELAVAASAGPDVAMAAIPRPTAAEPARPTLSQNEAANSLIRRIDVPPPKTA